MSRPDSTPALPTRLVERGAVLLHAQCWLWGQDLKSPHGDLLARFGMERATFESAVDHRRFYRAVLTGGRFVVAWGGGLMFGDADGALFFPRMTFFPRRLDEVRALDSVPDLHYVRDVEPRPLDSGRLALVKAALTWLAEYEEDVFHRAGASWRAECSEVWSWTESEAESLAASVGVEYQPLEPLPREGLGAAWLAMLAEGGIENRRISAPPAAPCA